MKTDPTILKLLLFYIDTTILFQWMSVHLLLIEFETVFCILLFMGAQWLSGRVLDSQAQASPASLSCVLEQDTFYTCLVLVQPRKTRPNVTARLLNGT